MDRSRSEPVAAAGIGREQRRGVPRPPPLSLYTGGGRERNEAAVQLTPSAMRAATGDTKKRMLSKQLSMKETSREVKWEKRRRQIQRQRSSMAIHLDHYHEVSFSSYSAAAAAGDSVEAPKGLTDGDLDELKGSMELGFGFDEENGGQNLCDTLPALDLYFAVNRQLLPEPKMRVSTSLPSISSMALSYSPLCSTPSPRSPAAQPSLLDSLNISSPAGDNPQLVKTRLRHWAQVVACSVKHSS